MPKQFGTAGPRAIYPDMATSRSLAGLSVGAQLLFVRLIAQADDQGRLAGDAVVVKALCVPLVDAMSVKHVQSALDELASSRLILRYGSPPLIQIVTWWTYQAGQRRAYPSRWPAPDGWLDHVYGHGGVPMTYAQSAGIKTADSPQSAGASTADSPQSADISPQIAGLARGRAQPLPVPVPSAGAGASAVPRDTPPPPTSGGRRIDGTNPRANGEAPRQTGDAPRQNGTSTRQVREDQKRGPTRLGDVMAQVARRDAFVDDQDEAP